MPSNFPTSVDTFTKPTTADTLASAVHHLLHGNATDAILAIENALGTTGAPGSLLNAFLTALTAADGSVVVGGTATHPTVATGTLSAIASAHPPAADWSNNSHKITALANGTASTDAAAFGQIPAISGTPATVGQANSTGSSGTLPNSDHVHQGVTSVTAGTGVAVSGGDGSGHGGITVAVDATVATLTGTQTLTNKRTPPRLVTVTQSATPSTSTDNGDIFTITGLAQAITSMTTNLTGTPADGEKIEFRITDNGTARAITWGASFAATTVALPTTTVVSTRLRVVFEWDSATSVWACVGVA